MWEEKLCLCVDGDNPLLLRGVLAVLSQELPQAQILAPGFTGHVEQLLLILQVSAIQRASALIGSYRSRCPAVKIILLYEEPSAFDPIACLTLGCQAVRKSQLTSGELLDCIRLVHRGLFLWEEDLTSRLISEAEKHYRFLKTAQQTVEQPVPTQRELDIAQAILDGLGNEEIGRRLYLSAGTVKNNIALILEKYGFQSRAQIVSLLAV